MTERTLTITDYGKDYGFGRFVLKAPGITFGHNDYREIMLTAWHFAEPCEGCCEALEDCPGFDNFEKTYYRNR